MDRIGARRRQYFLFYDKEIVYIYLSNPILMTMAPIHILLVEDNEGDILLTLEALHDGSLPIEVSVVRDGWEALQFLAQEDC